MIVEFWKRMSRVARVGLVAGTVLAIVTAGVAVWLLRPELQVLFADLSPQDAAAMAAELDRMKVPYRLGDDPRGEGTVILVDRDDVHRVRLKLMGKDLGLHGAVGFELFNNSDFGMTEFSQKVSYQRALQGELTRTILSLAEIRDARVLLALPDQGLFKQPTARPKASVTLTLRPGRVLRAEQVVGIQRLVSAAVPGIATQDVTLVDQSGVALTRGEGDAESDGGPGRLDLKKETERYLSRKATQVLEGALGAGQALASVDVELETDRVQTTVEDVVSPPGRAGQALTGVVVRERESLREVGAPLDGGRPGSRSGPQAGASQREVEYAVGRRIEQVVRQPGSIRRLQVVAVVRQALDPAEVEHLRQLVAGSVGASAARGDEVVVQSIRVQAAAAGPGDAAAPPPIPAAHSRAAPERAPVAGAAALTGSAPVRLMVSLGLGLALAIVAAALGLRARARGGAAVPPTRRKPGAMSEPERQAALAQVRAWLSEPDLGRPGGLS